MRKLIQLAAMALCLIVSPALAQEEHGQMSQLYVVFEEWVKPGMNEDYEAGTKLLIGKLSSEEMRGIGMEFYSMMEEDNVYAYAVPLVNFADIDRKAQTWSSVITSIRGEEAWEKRMAAVSASRYTIWMEMPGLSYEPQNPRLQGDEEMIYLEYIMMQVKPGKEADFVHYAREIKALFEKHEITAAYAVFRCIVGEVGPVYIFMMPGKDPADSFTAWQVIMEKFGAEWMEVDKKSIGTYSSSRSGRIWWRHDLSHMQMPQP